MTNPDHPELMERARNYAAYVRLDDADDIDTGLCEYVEQLVAALEASEQERERLREALVETLIPLEVIRGQIPHIRLGPLRRKLKLFSPHLQESIEEAVVIGRTALSPSTPEENDDRCV